MSSSSYAGLVYDENWMGNLALKEGTVHTPQTGMNHRFEAPFQRDIIVISDDEEVEELQVKAVLPGKRHVASRTHSSSQPQIADVSINHEANNNTRQTFHAPQKPPKRQKLNNGSDGLMNKHNADSHQDIIWARRPDHPNVTTAPNPVRDVKHEQISPETPHLLTESKKETSNTATASSGFTGSKTPSNRHTKKRKSQAPYFDDPSYGIRMYRGPGYERFAIALGTDRTHNEICNKWAVRNAAKLERARQKQIRYNEFGAYVDQAAYVPSEYQEEGDDEEEEEDEEEFESRTNMADQRVVAQIMEVLPDIDASFVLDRVKASRESFKFGPDRIHIEPDVQALLAEILDLEKYPKQKSNKDAEVDPLESETGKKITFTRDNEHTNRDYLKDAVMVLATQFTHVPTHYINKIVHQTKSAFDAYVSMEDADTNHFQREKRPYHRLRQPRILLEKKYQRPNPSFRNAEGYRELVNEVQAAKQHIARESLRLGREKEKLDSEAANLAQHQADGNLVECQCCFDDEIPINRAVACESDDVHWFCFGCVKGLAEVQVGSMKYEMLCMDGGGCKFKLSNNGVAQAIPIKVFDRLAFYQQQAEIAAAGLEGLEQCPWCDFRAICDPIEQDPAFRCQNLDCFKITCRKCHEPAHQPKTCEQFKNDRGLNARHKVEEARSEAMMRSCPKCKTKIIKEFGCNKMRCTCKAVMCYVCKEDISDLKDGGYDHFNRKGATCILYDEPNVDRHIQEADDAEKLAIQKAKEFDATLNEAELQIETGKKEPKKSNTTTKTPGGRRAWLANDLQFEDPQPNANFPFNVQHVDYNAGGGGLNRAGLDGAQDQYRFERNRLEDDLVRLQQQVMAQRDRLNDPLRHIADYGQELAQAQRIRAHHDDFARRRRQSTNKNFDAFIPPQQFRTNNQQLPHTPLQAAPLPAPMLGPQAFLPPLDLMQSRPANTFGTPFNNNVNLDDDNNGMDFMDWQYEFNQWNYPPARNDEALRLLTGLFPAANHQLPKDRIPQHQQQVNNERF